MPNWAQGAGFLFQRQLLQVFHTLTGRDKLRLGRCQAIFGFFLALLLPILLLLRRVEHTPTDTCQSCKKASCP